MVKDEGILLSMLLNMGRQAPGPVAAPGSDDVE